MSQKYLFPCSCGHNHLIEPSQAGQAIDCSCGKTLTLPTFKQIKELSTAVDPSAGSAKPATGNLRRAMFLGGWILLIASTALLGWVVTQTKPSPRDVTNKQVEFVYGQNKVYQDSIPIPQSEQQVLLMEDYHFDMMMPSELYYYFDMLKRGPNFSANFHENYQALKDAYTIRIIGASVLVGIALFCIVLAFFMPKNNVEVVGWSGTEWR